MAPQYDPDWTRAKGWEVAVVNVKLWDLSVGDILNFAGKGEGKDADTITNTTTAKALAKKCKHDPVIDTVLVTCNGGFYRIVRSGDKLDCFPKKSGGIVWTAIEGG